MKKIVFVFLLMFLFTACRGQSDKGAVTFLVFGDPEEYAAYEELVAAFEADHPEIDIQLGHIPSQGEYRQRLATDFSGGQPPDVMLINYRRFGSFASQGGLEPLGPYLEKSEIIQAADFYEQTIDAFQLDGQLWCIPQNISSLVVYFNQDLFDAAGVPYPAPGWTRDDFLVAARALTQDLDGDSVIDQYGASIEPTIFRLAPFVWQNGGDIVDSRAQPTRLTLDSPEAITAFQWLVDLRLKEGVTPDAVAESSEDSETRFLNGRLAMIFDSRRATPLFRTITSFTWDIAPLPRGERESGILHSDAYCMAALTEDKEAAWTFIEFANSATGQTIIAQSGRTVPSLRAVAESDAFLDPTKAPASSHIFLDTIPVLGQVPIMTTWLAIEETASQEVERAYYGRVTVAQAAEAATVMTQEYFDRANARP
ncbi:MAG: sugar ABC transporter substrate-binding protein [Anaerolineae bacterium]|nr:sugar ABC transporter substrate-binding protein [Anaerolineae bacterium]